MQHVNTVIIFLLLIIGGFLLESLFFQFNFFLTGKNFKKYHYNLGRFISYLIAPAVACFYAYTQTNYQIINIFLIFSIVGVVLEWLAGFTYHMVVGQRLWTYHRLSFSGYTSLLSIPLWGIGGVFFWLIAKIFA